MDQEEKECELTPSRWSRKVHSHSFTISISIDAYLQFIKNLQLSNSRSIEQFCELFYVVVHRSDVE
jgi:6-pyruvoyl-tetrahydropterin synthase